MSYENRNVITASRDNVEADKSLLLAMQDFNAVQLETFGTLDRARVVALGAYADSVDATEEQLIDYMDEFELKNIEEFEVIDLPRADGSDLGRPIVAWVAPRGGTTGICVAGIVFVRTAKTPKGHVYNIFDAVPLVDVDENGRKSVAFGFEKEDLKLVQAMLIELDEARDEGILPNLSDDVSKINDPYKKIGENALDATMRDEEQQ